MLSLFDRKESVNVQDSSTASVVTSMLARSSNGVVMLASVMAQNAYGLSLADQERELRIAAEGLLMQAEMAAWERTGDFAARGAADAHKLRMTELIAGRSAEAVASMERDRGLE